MKIEQLLYGYDDGHTLLTGSILINSAADSARLAMLSDWSGYRTTDDDDSYLTAFPLVDSPYYVVANHGMPMKWNVQVVFGHKYFLSICQKLTINLISEAY